MQTEKRSDLGRSSGTLQQTEGAEVEIAEEMEGAVRSLKYGALGGAWDVPLLLIFFFSLYHTFNKS